MHLLLIASALSLSAATLVAGQGAAAPAPVVYPDPEQRVLSHREQHALVTPWIRTRFDTVLPGLMAREGIDMWIIPTREYNEDPVFASLAPLTTFASRRRTILVFHNPGGGKPVERLSIGRFDYDGLVITPGATTDQDVVWWMRQRVVELGLGISSRRWGGRATRRWPMRGRRPSRKASCRRSTATRSDTTAMGPVHRSG